MKVKECFWILLFGLFSCTEDMILPEGGEKENYELKIVSPENKVYQKGARLDLEYSFFSNHSDSVGTDSVHWYSNLSGRIDNGKQSIPLKTGIHTITCKVFRDNKVTEKSLLVEISDRLIFHTKNIGNGWEKHYFTGVSDQETKIYCYKIKLDNNGKIYVSTQLQGIIYQTEDGWRNFSEMDGFTNNTYEFLLENGEIVAGDFWKNYMYFYKNGVWTKSIFPPHSTGGSLEPRDDVHSIVKDSEGKYWIGLHSGKILIYNNGTYFSLEQPRLFPRTDQLIFKHGKIYVIGEFSGVFVLEGNEWKEIVLPGDFRTSWRMRVTDDETIWVTGYLGVYKYKNGEVTKITENENPFFTDKAFEIFIDSKNRIWVTTKYGVSVKDENGWKNFSSQSLGYEAEKFSSFYIEEDQMGNIWFVKGNELLKYSGN